MSSKEPLNIVVLGGSFAGLSAAHAFLRKTIDQLGITRTAPRYRIVLISPSTHFYWNIGAPRAIVSTDLIPHSKSFTPILEAFRDYPRNRFTFIHGAAKAVDFTQRTVTIDVIGKITGPLLGSNSRWSSGTRESGESRLSTDPVQTIPYHALILATGTHAESPLLSLHGPHEDTIKALDTFHAKLRDATSIIVAGGGPSGVECAGQLATFVNGKLCKSHKASSPTSSTFPSTEKKKPHEKVLSILRRSKDRPKSTASVATSSESGRKTIILISGDERLLPKLPQEVGEKAEKKLKKLGVNVMHGLRLLSAQELPSGSTRCVLSDELTISCDLYVAATGVHPNTQFLPSELLDASGYVSSDPQYLRVERAGDRVYAIGDCASWSKNSILDCYDSISTLQQNLKNDLLAFELKTQFPFGGGEDKLDQLEDWAYMQNPQTSQLCPITRFGGVGVLFGYRVPSLFVWVLKGRDYKVGKAKEVTGAGRDPYKPAFMQK